MELSEHMLKFVEFDNNKDRAKQPRSQGPLLLGGRVGEDPGNEVESKSVYCCSNFHGFATRASNARVACHSP